MAGEPRRTSASRRVLITGASGFVGSHLAKACTARGDEVHLLLRAGSSVDRLSAVLDRVDVHRIELDDRDGLAACFAALAPEAVFHLAVATRVAEQPDLGDVCQTILDLEHLMSLVIAAATAPHPPALLVRTGSLAEYGAGPVPAVEAQREAPETPYAASLVAGTHYLQMLRPRLPFAAVTARLGLVYGPGQSEAFFLPYCLARLRQGLTVTLRRPEDRRDLIAIEDVVDGLLAIAAAPRPDFGIVNLTTGIAPEMAEVATLAANAMAADPRLIEIAPGARAPASILLTSPMLAWQALGWRARLPVAEGIARMAAAMLPDRPAEETSA